MNSLALTIMILSMGTVSLATAYFFYKVLTTPPKPEPDSYADNEYDPRDEE